MDAERWQEIDRVFAAVLERPPGERAAYLAEACAGRPTLRREVERLLAADERNATFLERPVGESLVSRFAAEEREEGSRLGPYRLLSRIGGGGMGAVYRARRDDEHYQSEVAVKILRSGLESTDIHHRFLAERQILARLEHPNIARLYDGGSTEDGRPFLVMELVEGLPVDRYCDRHRLTLHERLALFRRICAAVQHAHQNLLVHRDLKPGNILVTAGGEPKLLDFGIAKQLEPAPGADPGPTRTGLRVMTPHYASPEQVRGQAVTTASDVYSLGVLLYELLAGRSPYRLAGDAPYEVERAICEQEPERPSVALFREAPGDPSAEAVAAARRTQPQTLHRSLQEDLDNIVLMALRKDPARRYGSAAQLSGDLERHLGNRPVVARPDTLVYRSRKFVRRHWGAVAVAGVGAALVAGFVLSLIAQGRRLAEERDKARYALSFLVDTFKEADPYHTWGEQLTAGEVLAQGAERVSRDLSGEPDVQAALMDAIGEVQLGLGQVDEAAPLLTAALERRRTAFGPESLDVAASLEHVASLKFEQSDFPGSEKLLREALAIKRRRLGDDLEVAKTLNQLGETLIMKAHPPQEVEPLHREALKIARAVEGPAGPTVVQSMLWLAKLEQSRGSYGRAESLFREALDVERRSLGREHPRLYRDQTVFGEILIEAGKFKEAERVLRETLKAQREILPEDHPDLAVTLGNLAEALRRQTRFAESEALNRQVLAIVRSRYGESHWIVAAVLGNLAASLDAQNRAPEAIPYLEQALAIRRRSLGEEHPLVAQAQLLLAGAHRGLGHYPEALLLARQALATLEKAQGPDHPHVAHAARALGLTYFAQKRYAEAEPFLRRSLDIRRRELPPEHPDLAKAKVSLAGCLFELGRFEEANALAWEADAVYSSQLSPEDEHVKGLRDLQGKLRKALGRPAADMLAAGGRR